MASLYENARSLTAARYRPFGVEKLLKPSSLNGRALNVRVRRRLQHPFCGELEGTGHARRVGDTLAGDVEGGAVVGADAQPRQADGDVHGGVEIEEFQRNEGLVVVGGQHGVVEVFRRVPVDAVGHAGAGKARPASTLVEFENSGGDDAAFFVAEGAVFAVVRVEARDGDARFLDADALQEAREKEADADELFLSEQGRHVFQRDVGRGEGNGQVVALEAHGEVVDAESGGKEFRLSGEGETDAVKSRLADGPRDDGVVGTGF